MSSMSSGYIAAGDFFGSIMAGLLLGAGADWLFNTRPTFIVIGIIVGSVSGFYQMWRHAVEADPDGS